VPQVPAEGRIGMVNQACVAAESRGRARDGGHSMSSGKLRIAITADPELPVPPRQYGGIERVIHFLVDGLSARGHEVVLFAHRESHTSCELVPYGGLTSGTGIDLVRNSCAIVRRLWADKFDVIHGFGRLG